MRSLSELRAWSEEPNEMWGVGRTSGAAEQDLCSSCVRNVRIDPEDDYGTTYLQCLRTVTRVISNVWGERSCQRGWAKRLIDPGETHQEGTPASDRPADCVRCPIDAILVEERGLFDGDGIFRWALWSRHGEKLHEGIADCSLKPDSCQTMDSHARGSGCVFQAEGERRCSALKTTRRRVVTMSVQPLSLYTSQSAKQRIRRHSLSLDYLACIFSSLRPLLTRSPD